MFSFAKTTWIWVVLVTLASGCSHFQEAQNRYLTKRQAARAYKTAPDVPHKGRMAKHFQRGWKAGYYDVAQGGQGEPPLMPPQTYWSFKYQNAQGAHEIATWYEGFQQGAIAAHHNGVHQFTTIPTSPFEPHECYDCQVPAEEVIPASEIISSPLASSTQPVSPVVQPVSATAPLLATPPVPVKPAIETPAVNQPTGSLPSAPPTPEGVSPFVPPAPLGGWKAAASFSTWPNTARQAPSVARTVSYEQPTTAR